VGKAVIAETGAGQHGVAGHGGGPPGDGVQYLHGTEDIRRQRLNVIRMKLLGAGSCGGIGKLR
jgi:tryptophan synthase beta subunit